MSRVEMLNKFRNEQPEITRGWNMFDYEVCHNLIFVLSCGKVTHLVVTNGAHRVIQVYEASELLSVESSCRGDPDWVNHFQLITDNTFQCVIRNMYSLYSLRKIYWLQRSYHSS